MTQPNSADRRGPFVGRHDFSRTVLRSRGRSLHSDTNGTHEPSSDVLQHVRPRAFFSEQMLLGMHQGLFGLNNTFVHRTSNSRPCHRATSFIYRTGLLPSTSDQEDSNSHLSPCNGYNYCIIHAPRLNGALTARPLNGRLPANGANRRALCGVDQGRFVPLPQHFCLYKAPIILHAETFIRHRRSSDLQV
ncbi:hypothetical protein Taro_026823 [Colocasia esculenta]|uniref:Uncharacterized protein n=1 Tax=Colocasia esculenta TaxID=4460 RepID=A0A843VGA9_COLES|nr:hypothetical protein [Colocasia esculenta]